MTKGLIPHCHVPRDEEDPRFVRSFSLEEPREANEFFAEFGFVVFRGILSPEECERSFQELCSLVGLDPARPETWARWPKAGMEKYAMPLREPNFEPTFLHNRQSPNLLRAFSHLLGREDLLVNHDRTCLFRPTRQVPCGDGSARDMPQWRTDRNLHFDLNPWRYADLRFSCRATLDSLAYSRRDFIFENNQVTFSDDETPLQGVINFLDNHEEDGGFIIVPKFRDHFGAWLAQHRAPPSSQDFLGGDNGYRFAATDPLHSQAIRVPMRQGSVVIWDQRTPHGSTFNQSGRFRAAQFVKMFPNQLSPERALRRSAALWRIFRANGFDQHLSPTGLRVFGL